MINEHKVDTLPDYESSEEEGEEKKIEELNRNKKTGIINPIIEEIEYILNKDNVTDMKKEEITQMDKYKTVLQSTERNVKEREDLEKEEKLEEVPGNIVLQDISLEILNKTDEVLEIIIHEKGLEFITKEDLARICEQLQVLLVRRNIQIDSNIRMIREIHKKIYRWASLKEDIFRP